MPIKKSADRFIDITIDLIAAGLKVQVISCRALSSAIFCSFIFILLIRKRSLPC